jgi:hypothetical protein
VKLLLCLLCVPVLGVVVMLLWNWVMPPIFPGVAEIGFWRALGLLVLCRVLFGAFAGGMAAGMRSAASCALAGKR